MAETTGISTAPDAPEEPPTPEVARANAVLDAIDFELPARSRLGAWLRVVAWVGSAIALISVVRTTTHPLTNIPKRSALNGDSYDGMRYGITLEKRKAMFAELAKVETAERARAIAQNTWNGHAWSREDDRGHYEMTTARSLAAQYGVTLTQVYMVLDEGIREKWPGPDGKPLLPSTPPQDPRSTW